MSICEKVRVDGAVFVVVVGTTIFKVGVGGVVVDEEAKCKAGVGSVMVDLSCVLWTGREREARVLKSVSCIGKIAAFVCAVELVGRDIDLRTGRADADGGESTSMRSVALGSPGRGGAVAILLSDGDTEGWFSTR